MSVPFRDLQTQLDKCLDQARGAGVKAGDQWTLPSLGRFGPDQQGVFKGRMEDDHLAFLAAGVPSVDLIDFSYGYNNVFWHTPEDTVDKVSAKSLQIVGDTVMELLRLLGVKVTS